MGGGGDIFLLFTCPECCRRIPPPPLSPISLIPLPIPYPPFRPFPAFRSSSHFPPFSHFPIPSFSPLTICICGKTDMPETRHAQYLVAIDGICDIACGAGREMDLRGRRESKFAISQTQKSERFSSTSPGARLAGPEN